MDRGEARAVPVCTYIRPAADLIARTAVTDFPYCFLPCFQDVRVHPAAYEAACEGCGMWDEGWRVSHLLHGQRILACMDSNGLHTAFFFTVHDGDDDVKIGPCEFICFHRKEAAAMGYILASELALQASFVIERLLDIVGFGKVDLIVLPDG